MEITLDLSDELVAQITPAKKSLAQIIALGLREFNAKKLQGFHGLSDVLEFLADLPSPEEILALKPSAQLQNEIEGLLEKNKNEGLSAEEELNWQQYQYVEHLVRKAKIKAQQRINQR